MLIEWLHPVEHKSGWTFPEVNAATQWLNDHDITAGKTIALSGINSSSYALLIIAAIYNGIHVFCMSDKISSTLKQQLLQQCGHCDLFITNKSVQTDIPEQPFPAYCKHTKQTPLITPHTPGKLLVHTSGSSDHPKIVVLSLSALQASAAAVCKRLKLTDKDRYIMTVSLDHIAGIALLFRSLHCGMSLVIFPRFLETSLNDVINNQRITGISLVPVMLRRLIQDRKKSNWPSTLRVLMIGGDQCGHQLFNACAELGVKPILSYGMSECASTITCQYPHKASPDHYGPALSGYNLSCDPTGTLIIRCPALMDGYHPTTSDGPLSTWISNDILQQNPDTDTWTFTMREDRVFQSGGENVNPNHVQHILCQHTHIDDAYVWGIPHQDWGMQCVAIIQCHTAISKETLTSWWQESLAPHERPKIWKLVAHIPRTHRGKPDQQALLRMLDL